MELLNHFCIGRRYHSLEKSQRIESMILTTPGPRKNQLRTFLNRRILKNNIPQLQTLQINQRRFSSFELSISQTKLNIPKQITNKSRTSLPKHLRTQKTMASLNQNPSLKRLSLIGTDPTLSKEINSAIDNLPSRQQVKTCTYKNQFTAQQSNRYRYFIIKKSHKAVQNVLHFQVNNVKFTNRKSKLMTLIGKGYQRNYIGNPEVERPSEQLKPWSQDVRHFEEDSVVK